MSQVVVVGSLNVDVHVVVDRLPAPGETVLARGMEHYPGGKGLNQAVAAARVGADVTLIGALGDDDAATMLAGVVAREGIAAQLDRCARTPSGTALIEVAVDGENRIVVVPGANALLTREHVRDAVRSAIDVAVVLAQAEIPLSALESAMVTGRSAGALTVLNPSPALQVPAAVMEHVDVVVANEHEAAILTGLDATGGHGAAAAAAALVEAGATTAIVTRGAEGAAWAEAGRSGSVAAFAVEAIDTVGAGDAFCGALCAALAGGVGTEAALRWASAAGALAASRAGAVPSLPTETEVRNLVGRS